MLRSDGENSIQELKRSVKAAREEQTMIETAPRGDHQANGEAEQCVGEVAGRTRVLKVALEKRIGGRISADRAVLKWAVEYVGFVSTRFKVGEDGLTPYERLKGRKFKRPLVEFGELVMAEVHKPIGREARQTGRPFY